MRCISTLSDDDDNDLPIPKLAVSILYLVKPLDLFFISFWSVLSGTTPHIALLAKSWIHSMATYSPDKTTRNGNEWKPRYDSPPPIFFNAVWRSCFQGSSNFAQQKTKLWHKFVMKNHKYMSTRSTFWTFPEILSCFFCLRIFMQMHICWKFPALYFFSNIDVCFHHLPPIVHHFCPNRRKQIHWLSSFLSTYFFCSHSFPLTDRSARTNAIAVLTAALSTPKPVWSCVPIVIPIPMGLCKIQVFFVICMVHGGSGNQFPSLK